MNKIDHIDVYKFEKAQKIHHCAGVLPLRINQTLMRRTKDTCYRPEVH